MLFVVVFALFVVRCVLCAVRCSFCVVSLFLLLLCFFKFFLFVVVACCLLIERLMLNCRLSINFVGWLLFAVCGSLFVGRCLFVVRC